MPRLRRPKSDGLCAHVLTRGNAKATIFHSEADYANFAQLMVRAQERVQISIFAWCLMPNHVHLVLRPRADGELGRWMHWLLTTHAQRHRAHHGTIGHLWQGRYKAFPIQTDLHLLTVLRYVERNPVRAGLVDQAQAWRWSSAKERHAPERAGGLVVPSPVPLPDPWLEWVNTPLTGAELASVRTSVQRSRPFGDASWSRDIANRLGLLGTLRPRGRPRKRGLSPFRGSPMMS